MNQRQRKWDRRFLELAELVAGWSKDPGTKCGAVIVDEAQRVVSLGFNGLPRGVKDDAGLLQDRDVKLQVILHAETNALMFAGRDLTDCTIYTWPMSPCAHCASQIIQAGLSRVVSVRPEEGSRWRESFELADRVFGDRVVLDLIEKSG